MTLAEGPHWVLQDPGVLQRNACFMTPGSRLRRRDTVKLGWCWWANRHTWLGIASCGGRRPV